MTNKLFVQGGVKLTFVFLTKPLDTIKGLFILKQEI